MAVVAILSAPSNVTPPEEAARPWADLSTTWTGANGDSFDLRSHSGVCLLLDQVEGLLNPPVRHQLSSTPARAGARLRGVQVLQRDVTWPMFIWSDTSSRAWCELNDRWFASLDFGAPGVWEVTRPDGQRRRLDVIFTGDGGSLPRDPVRSGWARYAITGLALDPYWRGDPVARTFHAPVSVDSLRNGRGASIPFRIGSAASMATASVANLGDVDAWPTYTVHGPCTAASIGVMRDGRLLSIGVPFALAAGQWVSIDVESQVVLDHAGVSRRPDLSAASKFVPIPRGASIPVTMTMTGTGRIEVEFTPRYLRGF